ncbi:MAG TPA: D-ornithine 4,5-aminomutase subunit OraS [Bacteroidales bacterium]|nr:D-ornithine 4,5-aminomutase subunit OraS [Bacteroidales bacterium]HRW33693.1 D-ornithine 4,5-aminomutase subunit OraS [Thermotogota bacterium]
MTNERFKAEKERLEKLSDEQLNDLFWKKAEEIVNPLIDLAQTHTSPSIERSVLLRMGFNSLEAKKIVEGIFERDLLGKGAGNILLELAKHADKDYLTYGKELVQGSHWDEMEKCFKGV